MTVVLSPAAKQQFFDNNGRPLVAGKLFTYLAGTSTKTPSYTDAGGLTANSNPVILDYRGECNLWVPPNLRLKYVLSPASDSDPPTNPIWTINNLAETELITLYGGVDSGVANAYVLTFVANFTAYQDGIVIYFVPSNTNTTASTINVNGLGAVNITNQDGTALTSNQIVINQVAVIMYKGGNFLLLSSGLSAVASAGTFAPAWSGFGGSPPTGNMAWQIVGRIVLLQWQGTQGVSTGNFMTIGNMPGNLRPVTRDLIGASPTIVIDNGAYAAGAFGFGALGVMQFNKGTAPPSGTGFTAAGNKGLPTGWCGAYSLS